MYIQKGSVFGNEQEIKQKIKYDLKKKLHELELFDYKIPEDQEQFIQDHVEKKDRKLFDDGEELENPYNDAFE